MLIDVIKDTLIDALKLLPFLFLAFLLIEVIEHKLSNKTKKAIIKSGKFGPLIGSILGAVPQCGFSVIATNLYITRILSLGSLIAIYLSTSDEMLPVLLSNQVDIIVILKLIGIKIIIGVIFGFLIDLILRKKENKKDHLHYDMCDHDHCHCKESIFKSSCIHTIKTLLFIMIITFLLNLLFEYAGNNFIEKLFLKDSIFGPIVAALVGLIPNCASSVILSELYASGVINVSSFLAGLLSNSGVAMLVLFKSNKNIKENISILGLLYIISILVGMFLEVIGFSL